ncbi:hypothetical protein [Longimicrobium sp.]|jgi:hypothetical protein|uniref:hypothetical protein n=1 Tax=Longimicrobium sp. TaxID=2029185 RepID=UPI002F959FEF
MSLLSLRSVALAAVLSISTAGAASAQQAAPAPAAAPAATASAGNAAAAERAPRAPRRDRNRVTLEELSAGTPVDLYTFLQRGRGAWLRTRGASSFNKPELVWVYRDGAKVGTVAALRQIQTSEIREIQYLDGSAATQQFGVDHGSGAILLRSR